MSCCCDDGKDEVASLKDEVASLKQRLTNETDDSAPVAASIRRDGPSKTLATSNIRKYRIGQYVSGLDGGMVSGTVVGIIPNTPEAGSGPGLLKIATGPEPQTLATSNISKYHVGQHVSGLAGGSISGTIVEIVPETTNAVRGKGLLKIVDGSSSSVPPAAAAAAAAAAAVAGRSASKDKGQDMGKDWSRDSNRESEGFGGGGASTDIVKGSLLPQRIRRQASAPQITNPRNHPSPPRLQKQRSDGCIDQQESGPVLGLETLMSWTKKDPDCEEDDDDDRWVDSKCSRCSQFSKCMPRWTCFDRLSPLCHFGSLSRAVSGWVRDALNRDEVGKTVCPSPVPKDQGAFETALAHIIKHKLRLNVHKFIVGKKRWKHEPIQNRGLSLAFFRDFHQAFKISKSFTFLEVLWLVQVR
jgi:hypothetical protein